MLIAGGSTSYDGTRTGLLVSGGSSQLCVESASTPEERETGLSGRRSIGDFDGMAFFADDAAVAAASDLPLEATASSVPLTTAAFWMKDTLIPLDLVFVGADGRVGEVVSMEPCTADPCTVYNPSRPYLYAIELPRDWARQFDLRPGVRLRLSPGCIPFDRD